MCSWSHKLILATDMKVDAVRFMLQKHGSQQPGVEEALHRQTTDIHSVAVHVGRPIESGDRLEVRRFRARRIPLAPAIVRHADHADVS